MRALFALFNHRLTGAQQADARDSLGCERIVEPPEPVRALWAGLPPEVEALGAQLEPVRDWLTAEARAGDAVLVQGDFGAVYLMVRWCLDRGLVPVYATTRRQAAEQHAADGTVRTSHVFRHVRFRRYGE